MSDLHDAFSTMSEVQRILDQLERACEGNAWHGPSVRELLKGISARQAAAKSVPAGHSIWEIVLHLAAWQDVVRRRLAGETIIDLPPELDWPAVPGTSETAWRQAFHQSSLRRSVAWTPGERAVWPRQGSFHGRA